MPRVFQLVSMNSKPITIVFMTICYVVISNKLSSAACTGVMCLTLHEKNLKLDILLNKIISGSIP